MRSPWCVLSMRSKLEQRVCARSWPMPAVDALRVPDGRKRRPVAANPRGAPPPRKARLHLTNDASTARKARAWPTPALGWPLAAPEAHRCVCASCINRAHKNQEQQRGRLGSSPGQITRQPTASRRKRAAEQQSCAPPPAAERERKQKDRRSAEAGERASYGGRQGRQRDEGRRTQGAQDRRRQRQESRAGQGPQQSRTGESSTGKTDRHRRGTGRECQVQHHDPTRQASGSAAKRGARNSPGRLARGAHINSAAGVKGRPEVAAAILHGRQRTRQQRRDA